ncbi:MAG TPA: IS21 family transposase [Actinophytocola sp.]|jgi:transposase|uniref:Mu transposase domain-containing protein n=1 Tax=Actinophytocola sp. TaxID=1872138 RepID=UPI002DFB43D6|nr:IS21 family transposase [Actinophytocola sp.]
MLCLEDEVEAHSLRRRGWSISAIARHLGHDRKTIRAYLSGERVPGRRQRRAPNLIDPFVEYCRLRLVDDPHLWAATLLDELRELGFAGSYQTLTAEIRRLQLRPHCAACAATKAGDVAIIDHPPGVETQWDWVELPEPPNGWDCGREAHLLVGALSHSSLWRGVLAESEDFPHLVEAIDGVVRRLGGVTQRWRFDRMATVCNPGSGQLTAAFAAVAKHYGVAVDICPRRRGNRKGVVEKANHSAAQRWWRTVGDDVTPTQAQAGVDAVSVRLDGRVRRRDGQKTTVGALAGAEPLRPAPVAPVPAELTVTRTVSPQGLVDFRGNHYSVPPGLRGTHAVVRHRLGADVIQIATASGAVLAAHRLEPPGAGKTVREHGHVVALEAAVLAAFSDAKPCRRKTRRPPSAAATAEADRLRGIPVTDPAARVVIDMSAYAATAAVLSSVPPADPAGGHRHNTNKEIMP